MHKTLIDLPLQMRKPVIALLGDRLADAVDLALQAKLAHWNVRGPNFIGIHELCDKVVDIANAHADLLAERMGQLGAPVALTVQSIAKETTLPKFDVTKSTPPEIITLMAKALAKFAKQSRAAIEATDDLDDEVTSDIFTQVTRETDKMLWFIEAHLQ